MAYGYYVLWVMPVNLYTSPHPIPVGPPVRIRDYHNLKEAIKAAEGFVEGLPVKTYIEYLEPSWTTKKDDNK